MPEIGIATYTCDGVKDARWRVFSCVVESVSNPEYDPTAVISDKWTGCSIETPPFHVRELRKRRIERTLPFNTLSIAAGINRSWVTLVTIVQSAGIIVCYFLDSSVAASWAICHKLFPLSDSE